MLNNIDALKIARWQHHRLFPKACNEFDLKKINLSSDKKVIKLTMIEEKAKLVIDVKFNIRELLYTEELRKKY